MTRGLARFGLAELVAALPAEAQQRTTINPIDIDYRYNFEQINQGVSYRTGADPAVVNHKGAYYLFETLADGYWRSTDLIHWTFITPSMWPNGGIVAPAVCVRRRPPDHRAFEFLHPAELDLRHDIARNRQARISRPPFPRHAGRRPTSRRRR